MSTQTDLIGLGAIGVLGFVLLNKLENIGEDTFKLVTTRTSEYVDVIKDFYTETSTTLKTFIPIGGEETRPVYVSEMEAMKTAPQDVKNFRAASTYNVGGYSDVAKTGTIIDKHGVSSNPSRSPVTVDDRGFGGSWAPVASNDKYVVKAAADSPFNTPASQASVFEKAKTITGKYTNWW